MSKYSQVRTCCVCGAKMPVLKNQDEYLKKGVAIKMQDGRVLFFCPAPRHSPEEIENAIHGVPRFERATNRK